MQTKVFELKTGFHWVDLSQPNEEEVAQLAERYGLHPTSVQDCLDPEHLPKLEAIGDLTFVILRAFDETCSADADTVQELTRKVALFRGNQFLLTVHRVDQPFIVDLRQKWSMLHTVSTAQPVQLLTEVFNAAVLSYESPLDQALFRIEDLESRIFRGDSSRRIIKDAFFLKRRLTIFKRILRMTSDLARKLHAEAASEVEAPFFQNVRENAEKLMFIAEELHDHTQGLLSLHLSFQNQRTNEASLKTSEVMRVLTIFSVFFMPLNFIAGVYGMNFDFIPELHFKNGYFFVLGVMATTALSIYLWFRTRGWLR